MAYIGQYRGGWRAQVQIDGKRYTKTFKLKKDASTWVVSKESEVQQYGDRHTFQQAADEYLERVTSRKESKDWERRKLLQFAAHFGQTYLDQIDSAAIARWRDHRLTTVSGSSVQREANLLRNIFTVAMNEWKWVKANPFVGVRLPDSNAPRQAQWTWRQIKQVLRADRAGKTEEVQQAFRVALHTGLRLAEVLSATYDQQRMVLQLDKTKTTKAGVRVEVPTMRRARKLFPVKFTVGANEASVLFSGLLKDLLIEGLTFHDSRASALTWMARRMDVMTLARISRHKDLRILLSTYYRERADQISSRL